MSRIGNKPVAVPNGVTIESVDDGIRVKGPKGTLFESIPSAIRVEIAEGKVSFHRPDDRKDSRALHGLARALVANMVHGVTERFTRELEIQGVGYRAEVAGKNLNLSVGYSHPVVLEIPEGLDVSVDRNVAIRIEGSDRNRLGQFVADIRKIRPPEPYKGKGIRHLNEQVRRKVGKAGASGA
jgi:large subunit ribosomal protein L6